MREDVLRDFFAAAASAEALHRDLIGALVRESRTTTRHPIVDMKDDFGVLPEHLIRVCDAFIEKQLSSDDLSAIGFCLQASNHFIWDGDEPGGERIANVSADWSAPEINHPINEENARKWRKYLLTGVNDLARTAV